jgi:hypothetical protein
MRPRTFFVASIGKAQRPTHAARSFRALDSYSRGELRALAAQRVSLQHAETAGAIRATVSAAGRAGDVRRVHTVTRRRRASAVYGRASAAGSYAELAGAARRTVARDATRSWGWTAGTGIGRTRITRTTPATLARAGAKPARSIGAGWRIDRTGGAWRAASGAVSSRFTRRAVAAAARAERRARKRDETMLSAQTTSFRIMASIRPKFSIRASAPRGGLSATICASGRSARQLHSR